MNSAGRIGMLEIIAVGVIGGSAGAIAGAIAPRILDRLQLAAERRELQRLRTTDRFAYQPVDPERAAIMHDHGAANERARRFAEPPRPA